MKRFRVNLRIRLLKFWHLLVSTALHLRYLFFRTVYVIGFRLWRWAGYKMVKHDTLIRAQWDTGIPFWVMLYQNNPQHGAYTVFTDPRYERD